MIGNDIVDLSLAKVQSNWRRKGFLQKIFSEKEQSFLLQKKESERELFVWLLWSMKEAAYKIVSRQEQRRFYRPAAFVCKVMEKTMGSISGTVTYAEESIATESLLKTGFIYTVAKNNEESLSLNLPDQILKLSISKNLNYNHLHEHTLAQYAKCKNEKIAGLSIQKCQLNIPFIFNQQTTERTAISLSHHGTYAGFVFN